MDVKGGPGRSVPVLLQQDSMFYLFMGISAFADEKISFFFCTGAVNRSRLYVNPYAQGI
jgi:hypothetical protein